MLSAEGGFRGAREMREAACVENRRHRSRGCLRWTSGLCAARRELWNAVSHQCALGVATRKRRRRCNGLAISGVSANRHQNGVR